MIEDYMEELKNNCSKSNKGDKEDILLYNPNNSTLNTTLTSKKFGAKKNCIKIL